MDYNKILNDTSTHLDLIYVYHTISGIQYLFKNGNGYTTNDCHHETILHFQLNFSSNFEEKLNLAILHLMDLTCSY